MFKADVKKYDPDDELEADREFDTIADAIQWIGAQRPYGFITGWVSDGNISRNFSQISTIEIQNNQLLERNRA